MSGCLDIVILTTIVLDTAVLSIFRRLLISRNWNYLGIILIFFLPYKSFTQNRSSDKNLGKDFWETGVEAGITTFFGDIDGGVAKDQPIKNNFAISFHISRNYNSLISLNGKVSAGRVSGEKKRSSNGFSSYVYFINNYTEYTFTAGINFMSLISKNVNSKLGLYGQSGFGLINFKSSLYNGSNDTIVRSIGFNGQPKTTELMIPVELKITYNIDVHSVIHLSLVLNRVDTDKLDVSDGNNNRDYYSLISFGYSYKLYPSRSKSISRKNAKGIRNKQ